MLYQAIDNLFYLNQTNISYNGKLQLYERNNKINNDPPHSYCQRTRQHALRIRIISLTPLRTDQRRTTVTSDALNLIKLAEQ